MGQDYYREIAVFMKNRHRGRIMTLSRNEDDREFLFQWLAGDHIPQNIKNDLPRQSPDRGMDARKIIEACALCGATDEKKFGYGDGSSGVMIILNSPRLISKMEIRLYKRESVEMIRKMVEAIKLTPARCYITNLLKCESADFHITPGQMMQNCLSVIQEEISLMKPQVVIVMGEMQPLQKVIHNSSGVFWFTIEHPITLLKNSELKRSAWATLKNVMAKIKELELQ